MAEYIDRAAIYEKLNNLPHEYRNAEQRARTGGIAACKEIVRYFPAADVVEVRHGKWILDGGYHMCSECYDYAPYYEDGEERLSYFCPFCGADMREE